MSENSDQVQILNANCIVTCDLLPSAMNSRVQIAQHELFVPPLWQGLRSGCRSRIDFLHRSLSFAATLPFIQLCLSQRGLLQVRVDRLRLCSLLRGRPALRNTVEPRGKSNNCNLSPREHYFTIVTSRRNALIEMTLWGASILQHLQRVFPTRLLTQMMMGTST